MLTNRILALLSLLLLLSPASCQGQATRGDTLPPNAPSPTRPARLDPLASSPRADQYRSGIVDPVAISVPAAIEQAVFSAPSDQTLAVLVRHLTASTADPYLRVKRIHDWITLHIAYDNDAFLHGKEGSQNPFVFLRNKRTTCGGFARLFKLMADQAGIETLYITGLSRNYISLNRQTAAGHAWNAVRIDGIWHIVDVTADNRGGFENDEFAEQKTYRDGSLFLSPAAKRIDNLAHKPEEQFVSPPLSPAEFLARPIVYNSVIRYGIEFAPSATARIRKILEPVSGGRYTRNRDELVASGDTWTLELMVPDDVDIDLVLEDDKKVRHPLHAWAERQGRLYRCHFRPPAAGAYTATIRASFADGSWSQRAIYTCALRASTGGAFLGPLVRLLPAANRLGIRPDAAPETTAEGGISLEVRHPESHTLYAYLYDRANKQVTGKVATSHLPGAKRFIVSLPDNGTWWLGIHARDIRTPAQPQQQVLLVPLVNRTRSADDALTPAGCWMGNWTPLTNGFRLSGSTRALPDKDGVYTLTCAAPAGSFVTSRLLNESGSVINGATSDIPNGSLWTSRFVPPRAGRFTARLYQLRDNGSMLVIAQSIIKASAASPAARVPALMPLASMFKNGVRVTEHSINARSGQHSLVVTHPQGTAITASIKNETGSAQQGAVTLGHGKTSTRIHCAAPTAGNWRLEIAARPTGASGYSQVLAVMLPGQTGAGAPRIPAGIFLATSRSFVDRGLALASLGRDGRVWRLVLDNPGQADVFCYLLDKDGKVVRGGVSETRSAGKYTALFSVGETPAAVGRLYLREGGKTFTIGQVRLTE